MSGGLMQTGTTRTGPFSSPAFCVLLALALTLAFTLARGVLSPVLRHSSPYTLFIAAVLIAGFARGALCGVLVMLGGGLTGLMLFSGWNGGWTRASEPLVSLAVFWMVAGLVLMMSNELRRHANAAFERLRPANRALNDSPTTRRIA